MARKLVVEFIGTFILVFVAVGTAVFGFEAASTVGIALAFGLVLMAMAYAFGGISGCHVNPAVTIGMVAARRQSAVEGAQYLVAQFAGGIVAAGVLQFLVDRLSPAASRRARPGGHQDRRRARLEQHRRDRHRRHDRARDHPHGDLRRRRHPGDEPDRQPRVRRPRDRCRAHRRST